MSIVVYHSCVNDKARQLTWACSSGKGKGKEGKGSVAWAHERNRWHRKAIKINNFQYFALMEKQRKTRAPRVFLK